MDNRTNGHQDGKNEAVSDALTHEARDEGSIELMVQRLVGQCGPLLKQQLERKARREPLTFDQIRVDRIMHDFEATLGDIQSGIVERVRSKLIDHVQHEIRRLLDDALDSDSDTFRQAAVDGSLTPPRQPADRNDSQASKGQSPARDRVTPARQPADRNDSQASKGQSPARDQVTPFEAGVGEKESNGRDEALAPDAEPQRQDAGLSAHPEGEPEAPHFDSDDNLYEGTVKLFVEARDSVRQVIHFVEALRRRPDLQLLQMVGSGEGRVRIWLSLRSPLQLEQVLLEMESVSKVDAPQRADRDSDGPLLNVQLATVPSAN